jgi:hypothetical protein
MPLDFDQFSTPKGRPVVRTQASGEVTEAEAERFVASIRPGGTFHGLATFHLLAPNTSLSPESRKIFASLSDVGTAAALVVPSPATRVLLNFIVKASALKAAALGTKNGETQFFSSADEALAWLDTRS